MKLISPLSVKAMKALTKDGFHSLGGVIGLCLRIRGDSRQYVLRFTSPTTGKRNSISLGNEKDISLAAARQLAQEYRTQLATGVDPVRTKRENKRLLPTKNLTFAKVADLWIDAALKSAKPPARIRQGIVQGVLRRHILPSIGNIPIKQLKTKDVFNCVQPHWSTTSIRRREILQLIAKVWNWAVAMEYADGTNPADIRGPLGVLLANLGTPKKHKNNGALLPEEVPDFIYELHRSTRMSAKALCFAILTASRVHPVSVAKWEDIDLEKGVWVVPEDDMKVKNGKFKVMLSRQAISILESLPKDGEYVFRSGYGGVTSAALYNTIREINFQRESIGLPKWIDKEQQEKYGREVIITAHGVARASFKTWTRTGENLRKFHTDAVELCLAHTIDKKYDGAYDRASLEEERRLVMAAWGEFCFSRIPQKPESKPTP